MGVGEGGGGLVAPDAAMPTTPRSGCGFEFKRQEMTILAMRTALFVGQCPVGRESRSLNWINNLCYY